MFQTLSKTPSTTENTAISVDDLILAEELPIAISDHSIIENAKSKAIEIYEHIERVSQRIQEAKTDAEYAQNMKVGFFGKTGKKATATSNALVRTNEAIAEMNDLIQEAIIFTKSSIEYSTIMMQAMSKMVEHGFKNANGEIIELNESGEEFAEIILSQADEYTNRHLQLVELQKEQKLGLDNVQKISDLKDAELTQQISELRNQSDQSDQEIQALIHLKTSEILRKSDQNDEEQLQKINTLNDESKKIKELSNANDLRHDDEIQQLFQLIKNQQVQLDSFKKSSSPIIISIISLSLTSALAFLTFRDML
ncbi:hypothetical protein [Marinomonas sp.]